MPENIYFCEGRKCQEHNSNSPEGEWEEFYKRVGRPQNTVFIVDKLCKQYKANVKGRKIVAESEHLVAVE